MEKGNASLKNGLLVVLFFVVLSGSLMIVLKMSQLRRLEKKLQPRMSYLRACQGRVENYPRTLKKNRMLKSEMDRLFKKLSPGEDSGAQIFGFVRNFETLVKNVSLETRDPSFKIVPIPLVPAEPFDNIEDSTEFAVDREVPGRQFAFRLTGRYHTFTRFLHRLTYPGCDNVVTVDSIRISAAEASRGSESPRLDFEFVMTVYFYEREETTLVKK